ncbi:WAS/WASL-interacting protein family member 2 isoform X2 [Onthophagus taurus]|uniref:WAS/WASL-interacting protein family member 2 isoform X2 n=1 Tax=Onthophagus taurus TaxID=166361 RepID=UPI000C204592|nr:WAS/WASL-interacting protein family member 2-like isoform X2 [Onthophagus taurus]XP_022917725.1 WAS/WASL-interacting protein family member 2-like isoform X2 [Onthophagus taurus]
MPGPPPPPPPIGGPPPPPAFTPQAAPSKGGGDQRDALLSAIRKGKNLKKTVTVDKSGPCIPGKLSNVSNNNSNTSNNNDARPSGPTPSGPPNGLVGLAALFPGGQIPKLRPVGGNHSSNNSNGHGTTSQRSPDSTVQQKNFVNTQNEIKKRMANDNKNRGPPPPAPSRTPSSDDNTPRKFPVPSRNGSANHHVHTKPGSVSDLSSITFEHNRSALHKRAVSNSNIGVTESSEISNRPTNLHPKPSYGKPNVAPKPPVLNGKIKPLNRTQSMKNPRSPSPQSPGTLEKNISNFGTVRNLKPDIKDALASIHQKGHRAPMADRPKGPPPSIPQQPGGYGSQVSLTSSKSIKHPGHAPPPPPPSMVTAPNQPPPVPPHRTAPHVPPRTVPPPPPSLSSNGNAPPPPPRIYSMKDNNLSRQSSSPSDFEARFKFPDVSTFPAPPKFKGVEKIYGKPVNGSIFLKMQLAKPTFLYAEF